MSLFSSFFLLRNDVISIKSAGIVCIPNTYGNFQALALNFLPNSSIVHEIKCWQMCMDIVYSVCKCVICFCFSKINRISTFPYPVHSVDNVVLCICNSFTFIHLSTNVSSGLKIKFMLKL